MLERYIFWLKSNFGFSRKESRGFLWVIPLLLTFYFLPKLVQKFEENSWIANSDHSATDSLLAAGWTWADSDPIFNRQDTAREKIPSAPEGIRRISFIEADSIVLQVVPGIGPTLAGRIIKYREALGGFRSKEQLIEVYGVTPEVGELVWQYFEFEPAIVKKIEINLLSISELAEHPYINYGQAKVIVAYREQHGPYMKPEDLLKIRIFTDEWISSISPYLNFRTEST